MQKMILFIFVYISVGISRDGNYVLMVSFDGFRYDYTSLAETPNFDKLAARGVKADGLIPVFPSLTFPNHYSIATGAYAGTHNITGNSFYDQKYGKKYSLYDRATVRDPKFYKAEPIWVTAERQGVQSASTWAQLLVLNGAGRGWGYPRPEGWEVEKYWGILV